MSPPVCAFSDRKLDTDREFFRWRCKLCGRRVHVVCGRVRAHKMPGVG